MTAKNGSNFVLQIETSTNVWESIPGERVSGYTIANESVDTTAKQQTSRELSSCGVKTVNITASGIVKDDLTKTLFNTLCEASLFNTIRRFRIISGIEIPVEGSFLVSSFARNGEYNGAEQWSLALESADSLYQSINIPIPPITPYGSSYAVSVRKVVSSYSGYCMRVRRSSDNTEQDIPFKDGWIDEVALLNFVGSVNGFVVAWYNQTPQYGAVSFTNADVLSQPQIVSSGVVIRSGGSGRPAVLIASTGKALYAPGGAYWLTASNNGMFMSTVSSSTIGNTGSLTRGLFGQDMPDGNSPAYIARWFTPSDRAHRVRLDTSLADIITNDSSVYPTSPLTDTNISASRSGSVRIYARGALNGSTQVTFPNRTGWTLRNTVIGTGAGTADVKMFEVIAQSQAWSEAYQLDLSKNQMLAFGIPGVY